MASRKPLCPSPRSPLTFFRQFLQHPLQIGSVIPSSRFLERRILEIAEVAAARTIVELGSGTGGTTRAILRAMPPSATLLSVELNRRFHALLETIVDPRLIPHCGDASDLREALRAHGLAPPEVVISGIPFSTMAPHCGRRVLENVASLMAPRGRFVAYQLSSRVARLGEPLLGPGRVAVELRNLPPMRIYRWEKQGS